jgi:Zn-dependent protease with chaperone function
MSMRAALLAWARKAELSCDRAALLVTQDANIIGRTMMKLKLVGRLHRELTTISFWRRHATFKRTMMKKALDRFWADVITSGLSHPFPVWRVAEILAWVEKWRVQSVDECARDSCGLISRNH